MFQLGEGAKRVDTKRRELARQCEHQAVRMEALEKELERQLSMSDELRRKVRQLVHFRWSTPNAALVLLYVQDYLLDPGSNSQTQDESSVLS